MKKLKLRSFEKAQQIYKEIKGLDNEIISLEKIAQEINVDECKIEFKLKNYTKKRELESENILDSGGYLKVTKSRPAFDKASLMPRWIYGMDFGTKKEGLGVSKTKLVISDTVCYKIIGVLLADKLKTRKRLLLQLEEMGVSN